MHIPRGLTDKNPIAFFSAEYGIEEKLHLYAGGLGILAGDFILEAGAQGAPFFAIGLFYPGGFSSHRKKGEANTEKELRESGFSEVVDEEGAPLRISIDVDSRVVTARAWVKHYGSARLYLLDTHLAENSEEDRTRTNYLYDSDNHSKMFQELVLGIGGVKLLRALHLTPSVYHLNEGHTSFVALALAAEYLHDHPAEVGISTALKAVGAQIVATKHTILRGAGIYFTREEFGRLVGHYFARHHIDLEEFFSWGADDDPTLFSATKFLLQVARHENGVSMLHTVFEKQKHPHSTLIPITNGVHVPRWRSRAWPRKGIEGLSDAEIFSCRMKAREALVDWLSRTYGAKLNAEALTLVWARRFAPYKRPDVLFRDPERLARILSLPERPVQVVISGIAHEADAEGQRVMREIIEYSRDPRFTGKLFYLPDYSIEIARELVAGGDVWLNTPERGKEACGTSGMKAAVNGVLQCSVSDGWVGEVDWASVGWVLPDEAVSETLYRYLEEEIAPLFFARGADDLPHEWISRVRKTIFLTEERYSASRMLEEYMEKLYFPRAREV